MVIANIEYSFLAFKLELLAIFICIHKSFLKKIWTSAVYLKA